MGWFFDAQHLDQTVGVCFPIGILVLDAVLKYVLGNRHLHSFGGDLALCGFVLYVTAVFGTLDPARLSKTALATEIGAVVLAFAGWFFSLALGSKERFFTSAAALALGLYSLALCSSAAWRMLIR